MIESIGTLYAGHIDLESVGFDSIPANDRIYTEQELNTVYSKAESIAKVMDSNGYDILWIAEHHFQREGYECIPNVLMLAIHLAHLTKNIRIGCGFNVSPMWHPLRMAEDYATAEILTNQRVVFGVGRGYHTREVESFGNPMVDGDANRELFEEQVDVMFKAFHSESFSHVGKNYVIPPEIPYRGYELKEITLVPRPLQRPVECWQPIVSASERGLSFMAKHGIKGVIGGGAAPGGASENVIKDWQRIQSQYGIETDLGGNLCIGFSFHIADSEKQAIEEARPFYEENMKMFAPLGMVKGLTDEQIGQLSKGSHFAKNANLPTLEQAIESGSWLVGTPESITEKLLEIQGRYLGLKAINVGQVIGTPEKIILEQLDRFGKEIMPKIKKQQFSKA
ncbi:MAG: Flavin-dependent oxidoreductase, luciferase family [Chloroflexi bacterium]|jgi:alkanesulfonate monooxygenase SsuD/methylene tetrahydromethanopterin reductase-like flavin-dependent oxidoreductase (luciferase family)|nr:MAG: Flavin-dependent oxidoreductase, luciferase family [Chloroflexota bacterium]